MSDYYRIKCITCDRFMGEYDDYDEPDDGVNHGAGLLCAIIAGASVLTKLETVERSLEGIFIDIRWLEDHIDCELVVMSEYGTHWFLPDGTRIDSRTASSCNDKGRRYRGHVLPTTEAGHVSWRVEGARRSHVASGSAKTSPQAQTCADLVADFMETNIDPRIEVEVWKARAGRLWDLLDDIDTLDDACRDSDADFRVRVRQYQQRRHQILTSYDGANLEMPRRDSYGNAVLGPFARRGVPKLTEAAAAIDPSLHGPTCECGHVRLDHWDHWEKCFYPGCDCTCFRSAETSS